MLDRHYAQWGDGFSAWAPGVTAEELNTHICTRIAGAVTALFSYWASGSATADLRS
ncbi:hypothetical protein O5291_21620 [Escherichia coli]|nr:hypothetical protein [Escherichia coli]